MLALRRRVRGDGLEVAQLLRGTLLRPPCKHLMHSLTSIRWHVPASRSFTAASLKCWVFTATICEVTSADEPGGQSAPTSPLPVAIRRSAPYPPPPRIIRRATK